MIKSLTKNPLLDILALHCKESIDLDLTWSTGQIWQKVNFYQPFVILYETKKEVI